jgi:hypothetical protein
MFVKPKSGLAAYRGYKPIIEYGKTPIYVDYQEKSRETENRLASKTLPEDIRQTITALKEFMVDMKAQGGDAAKSKADEIALLRGVSQALDQLNIAPIHGFEKVIDAIQDGSIDNAKELTKQLQASNSANEDVKQALADILATLQSGGSPGSIAPGSAPGSTTPPPGLSSAPSTPPSITLPPPGSAPPEKSEAEKRKEATLAKRRANMAAIKARKEAAEIAAKAQEAKIAKEAQDAADERAKLVGKAQADKDAQQKAFDEGLKKLQEGNLPKPSDDNKGIMLGIAEAAKVKSGTDDISTAGQKFAYGYAGKNKFDINVVTGGAKNKRYEPADAVLRKLEDDIKNGKMSQKQHDRAVNRRLRMLEVIKTVTNDDGSVKKAILQRALNEGRVFVYPGGTNKDKKEIADLLKA